MHTVKPRPEVYMDMILLKTVFEEHRLDSTTTDIYAIDIDTVIVLSDVDILQKHFKRIMSICAS